MYEFKFRQKASTSGHTPQAGLRKKRHNRMPEPGGTGVDVAQFLPGGSFAAAQSFETDWSEPSFETDWSEPTFEASSAYSVLERDADRVAEQVLRPSRGPVTPMSAGTAAPAVQRKGDAGSPQARVQQAPRGDASLDNTAKVPSTVHDTLASSGRPLDSAARAYFEPRFGQDFSDVRIHTDAQASSAARDVEARAFTVGRDIVFGAGEYTPVGDEGQRLLAHELAHVVQQKGGGGILQRACLGAPLCSAPAATLENFVAETQADPTNVSKADKRHKACSKVPPSPACTSDGHGARATALTALLAAHYPARLALITGIFVDKDMPSAYGAYTSECSSFEPPRPGGGRCTFVPDTLEVQARQYRGGAARVGGMTRAAWLTETLATLTHETEHARFDAAVLPDPSASCKFADHESNLSEMAAQLSEMHVYYRAALTRPEAGRFDAFKAKFAFWVANGSEDISGIVQDLRCKCACADADALIKKTVESVATNQGWDTNEATMIHRELQDSKWKLHDGKTPLNWPVAPPAAIDVNDLPTTKPTKLKL
jgi:hypothetical protein